MHLVIKCVVILLFLAQPSGLMGAETEQPVSALAGYGIVSFQGVPADKEIQVDGEPYGPAGLIGPTLLTIGEHMVRVGADGVPVRIMVSQGQTTRIASQLPLTNGAAPSGQRLEQLVAHYRDPTRERSGLLLAGAGTLSITIGLVFGASALDVAQESEGLKRDEVLRSKYDAIVETAQKQVMAANVFLISGSAMLISGLSMLYLDGYFAEGAQP